MTSAMLGSRRNQPAASGRLLMTAGLWTLAAISPFFPEPGEASFLVGSGALFVIAVGAVWTAHRLSGASSVNLPARAWAALGALTIAALAAPHASLELFSDEFPTALIVTYVAGIAACALFAWFVWDLHRHLHADRRPVFLGAAAASLLLSIPVSDADLLPFLLLVIPLVCLGLEVLPRPEGS